MAQRLFFIVGLTKQHQARAQWLTQDKMRRESLYKEFIEQASRCYGDAMQHHKPNVLELVGLYAKTSEMRVVSSPDVLAAAEDVVRQLIDTYSNADIVLTDTELKTLLQDGSFDLLRTFGEFCRAEFDHLRAQQF